MFRLQSGVRTVYLLLEVGPGLLPDFSSNRAIRPFKYGRTNVSVSRPHTGVAGTHRPPSLGKHVTYMLAIALLEGFQQCLSRFGY